LRKLVFTFTYLLLIFPCRAAVIYVDVNAAGANNGSSWTDAYNYLQDGLTAAVANDEVWVAHGTYTPDSCSAVPNGTGDRTATFQLISGVALYGGFAGFGAPDPNVRDPNLYQTILSGDLAGDDAAVSDPCDLLTEPTRAENSYHVIKGTGVDSTAIVDGFTITAGNASEDTWPNSHGAGMFNEFGCNSNLVNCTFINNSARLSGGAMINHNDSIPTLSNCIFISNSAVDNGGAIENHNNSSPIFINCAFSQNQATWGGAIRNTSSNPEITGCIFSENKARDSGGGIDNCCNSNPILTDCNFTGNVVTVWCGAGMNNNESSPSLTNCTFSNNDANYTGGGMDNSNSSPALTHCIFSENSAVHGGGMKNHQSSPSLTDCTFISNSADYGGGMNNYESSPVIEDSNFIDNVATNNGGGISDNNSNPVLNGCIFSGSSAKGSCGMDNCCGSAPTLIDCIFIGNTATAWSGGGMGNYESTPSLTNCAFSNNDANDGGGGIHNNSSNSILIGCTFSNNSAKYGGGVDNCCNSNPTLTNCSFTDNTATAWCGAGMNNNNSNPSLTNCTFSNNDANNDGGGMNNIDSSPVLTGCVFTQNLAPHGGGMKNHISGPSLTDCTFSSNFADDGGGISSYESSPNLTNCTFISNNATNTGGGMHNGDNSDANIINCTFIANSTQHIGGGVYNWSSRPTLTNCIFSGNIVTGTNGIGGGMHNDNNSDANITNCTFVSNSANEAGGGVYNWASSPTLANCMFSGNSAQSVGGGGLYNNGGSFPSVINCAFCGNTGMNGGGVFDNYDNQNNPTLINCIFSSNVAASRGGGMWNGETCAPILTNCTFAGNRATNGSGGGMHNEATSNAVLANCVLWGNTDTSGSIVSAQIGGDGTAVLSYSCVQDNNPDDAVVYPGTGNIDDNPLFVDADGPDNIAGSEDDNFRLRPDSPCLDAGDNAAVPPGVTTDLDGEPRIQNGIVDMGVYEGPTQVFVIEGEPVTVPEGDIEWFHISLALEPNEPVEVTVAYLSGDTDISVLYGSTLYFNSSNYTVPQPVILAAAEDDDYLIGTAVIRVSAFGIAPADVAAVESDNDPVPPVIYVDDDANGTNDGSSWYNAFNYLQDALYAVENAAGDVNDIWVAQGTYKPDRGQHQTPGDRTASFHLQSGVALYGGFAGFGAPDPNMRNPKSCQTILSGDLAGNDATVGDPCDLLTEPTRAENSYQVVTSSYTDATAIIDGFTITGGNSMISWPYGHGGGMFCYFNANCTVNNCTFVENTSRFGGGLAGNSGCDYLRVTNCTFLRNAASYNGGGIDLYQSHYVLVAGCSFVGNVGIETGAGAMSIISSSSPTLTNCTFSGNSGYDGGGIYNSASSPTITNCSFSGNSTDHDGAGIYNFSSSSPALNNCTFSGNSTVRDGGAMFNGPDCNPTLTDCTLSNNNAGTDGGAMVNGYNSSPTLTKCTFRNNNAGRDGGGVFSNSSSSPTLINCTLIANSAPNRGGGIYNVEAAYLTTTNCIIWVNIASAGAQIYNSSIAIISFSDVQDGYLGLGNIDADPCFVDSSNNNYHLKSEGWRWDTQRKVWTWDDITSRCIDAGNPGSPLGDELLAIPDDPNNEWGQNLRINMGAFGGTAEASIPPYDWALLADLTNDGLVDLTDFAFQAVDWLNSADQQPGDLDRDSLVGLSDLALLVEDWLKQTTWY
jgi:hypothetical protein